MDYPIVMKSSASRLKFSGHHTPIESQRRIFYPVLRAGHYRITPDYPMRSWSRPGHDLLLTLAGTGKVQIADRAFSFRAGELCWVDCRRYDISWPTRPDIWDFVWVRIDTG